MTKLCKIYGICLAVVTLVLACGLIYQAVCIYTAGTALENFTANGVRINPIYSRQIVGAHLKTLLAPAIIWAVMTLGALVINALCPADDRRTALQPEQLRDRLFQRLPEGTQLGRLKAVRKKRHIVFAVCLAVCLVCAVMMGIYLFNPNNFSSWELEEVMGNMLMQTLPWLLIALCAAIIMAWYSRISAELELNVLKAAPAACKKEKPSKTGVIIALRVGLYALGITFVVLGIFNGGMRDVLVKAIRICTECIGLG